MLTKEEVQHVARLARLALTEEEQDRYREQLSAILDYAQKLLELDTGDILPTSSVLPERTVLREDVPLPGLDITGALGNAPEQQDRQFKVPPILE